MIKAVIFDVDGVIFDSEQIHYRVEAKALREVGIPVSDDLPKEYSGVRLDVEFPAIAKRFNKEIDLQEAIKIRDRILEEELEKGFPHVQGADELIKKLSESFLLAVATSGERRYVGKQLVNDGLSKYFKVMVFGEDVTNPKPAPEPFLKCAELMHVAPSECVVVEDSMNGFKAAKAAGMTLIARKAEHNKNADFSLADFVVEEMAEIVGILKSLNSK